MARRSRLDIPKGQFGPVYNIAGLEKHRRAARDGLAAMSAEARRAYGAAVEDAVKAAQRRHLLGALEAERRPNCASGSWDTFPGDAVRRQQAAALAAYPDKVRKARTPVEWQSMYALAMADKARAISATLNAGARHEAGEDDGETEAA